MKNCFLVLFLFGLFLSKAQLQDSLVLASNSILKKIKAGDSIVYYQCHVEEAVQQLSTASGQTLTAKPQKFTIIEKYLIKKTADYYSVDYYTSSLTVFPNKKFSGLKIREKPYWEFKKEKSFVLSEKDIKILLAIEKKGREAIEYDYAITKYTTNQLIIKLGKDFKQLVIDGNYVLSKLFSK